MLRIAATPGYFDAIGMTALGGRTFDQQDSKPNSPLVAVVSETFAHFRGTENLVGKRIRYPGGRVIGIR